MSAATATTSSGPQPPPLIFRAADAETGGISLIGGGRAVSVISNLFCFVFSFVCFDTVFVGLLFGEKKALTKSFKTQTTNKAENTINTKKREGERERERERE